MHTMQREKPKHVARKSSATNNDVMRRAHPVSNGRKRVYTKTAERRHKDGGSRRTGLEVPFDLRLHEGVVALDLLVPAVPVEAARIELVDDLNRVAPLLQARQHVLTLVCGRRFLRQRADSPARTNARGLSRSQSQTWLYGRSQNCSKSMLVWGKLHGMEPATGRLSSIRGSSAAAIVVVQPPPDSPILPGNNAS